MKHSPVGRYLATLESRDELTFVRVYLNWWCPEAAAQPMKARVPGLTPSLQVEFSQEARQSGRQAQALKQLADIFGEEATNLMDAFVQPVQTSSTPMPLPPPEKSFLELPRLYR